MSVQKAAEILGQALASDGEQPSNNPEVTVEFDQPIQESDDPHLVTPQEETFVEEQLAEDEDYRDPETMAELADAIGRDPEWLYSRKIALADGAEPVTLGEVKDQLQTLNRENEELKQLAAKASAAPPVLTEAQQVKSVAQGELVRLQEEYQRVDWAKLEAENPTNAILQRQKYQEAYMITQQALQQADQIISQEIEKAKTGVWRDPVAQTSEFPAMSAWLTQNFGITSQRLNQETDPGILKALYKAWKTESQAAQPKPKAAPLTRLPQKRRETEAQSNAAKRSAIVEKGKKSRRMADKVDAVSQLLSMRK